MPRPQFTVRALLVAMLVVGAFFGGIHFERQRRRRADEAAAPRWLTPDEILVYPSIPIQLSEPGEHGLQNPRFSWEPERRGAAKQE